MQIFSRLRINDPKGAGQNCQHYKWIFRSQGGEYGGHNNQWQTSSYTERKRENKLSLIKFLERHFLNAVRRYSTFFKYHRNCLSTERSHEKQPILTFYIFNSYSFNLNGELCNRRSGFSVAYTEQGDELFLWFKKNTFCDSTAFFSFITRQANLCFFSYAVDSNVTLTTLFWRSATVFNL